MSVATVILLGLAAWLALACLIGPVVGRALRDLDTHMISRQRQAPGFPRPEASRRWRDTTRT